MHSYTVKECKEVFQGVFSCLGEAPVQHADAYLHTCTYL